MAEESEDWSFYEFYYDEICSNYDLLKKEFEKRQGTLTKQDIDLALLCAAKEGNIDGVNFLLDNGADVKSVDGNFDDAMILASSFGHIEIVKLLLEHGGPPNEANVHHYTPLVRACYEENVELTKLLLDHIDFKGCSQSISPRCEEENCEIPMTITYSNKFRPYPWLTPLMISVDRENLELVKMLIDAHIPLNEGDRKDTTALHHAIKTDCPEILDLLLAAKANVNAVDWRDTTPLMTACHSRKEDCMLLLLQNGADVTIKERTMLGKLYVLCEAARFASEEVMKELCEAGADVNYIDSFGHTPLSYALTSQNINAMRFLIRYGCKLDTPNRKQLVDRWKARTLFSIAVSQMNVDILRIMYAGGAFTNNILHECNNDEKLRQICEDNPEILEKLEKFASTPQTLAMICRKVVREVIEKPLPKTVPQLCLPSIISDFLLYSDI